MPVNYLIIESLQKFYKYYGSDFKVECPSGSGKLLTIREVANELARRLTRIFLKDESGRRPVFNDCHKMQNDPNFRDYILFHEYFHGENGRGVEHLIRRVGPDLLRIFSSLIREVFCYETNGRKARSVSFISGKSSTNGPRFSANVRTRDYIHGSL